MTERRECDADPGMICPCLAAFGRWGMSKLHVCVDVTFSPFGIFTIIGLVAGNMSITGVVVMMKWLVAPESRMAQSFKSCRLKSTICSRDCTANAYCALSDVLLYGGM